MAHLTEMNMPMLDDVLFGRTPLKGVGGRAQTIDASQAAVVEGRMFKHHKSYIIAAAATKRFLFVVPAGIVAYVSRLKFTNSDGPVYARLYESTIASANGTAAAVFNANRISSNTPSATLTIDPTITDAGIELEEHMIPGGNNDQGTGYLGEDYWILGPGTYQLSLEYTGATSSSVCVQVAWVE
jgi:hypothetical protein